MKFLVQQYIQPVELLLQLLKARVLKTWLLMLSLLQYVGLWGSLWWLWWLYIAVSVVQDQIHYKLHENIEAEWATSIQCGVIIKKLHLN